MQKLILPILIAIMAACAPAAPEATTTEATPAVTDSAAWVIAQAIAYQGGAAIEQSDINFTFREKQYKARKTAAGWTYERIYTNKENQQIADQLTPTGFTRYVDGEQAALSPKDSAGYANSLNSVLYFALLPHFLEDPAVQAEYQGVSTDFGKPYYELKVTFAENGGGKDFEDEYAYWFDAETFALDYLAYNFLVNGGGARFRQAYNQREVGGLRFADYINYKPSEDNRSVLDFDRRFQAGGMDTLSRIVLEQVGVANLTRETE